MLDVKMIVENAYGVLQGKCQTMRVLLVAPLYLHRKVMDLTLKTKWNLTCVESADEGLEFTKKTEFQSTLVTASTIFREGFHTISYLARNKFSSPIIAWLEINQKTDRVRALELGALTSIQLIADLEELEMAILAVVRTIAARNYFTTPNTIEVGGIVLNIEKKQFAMGETIISLQLREYQILDLLFLNKGKPVTRDRIMNHLYDNDEETGQKVIDVLVCNIRKSCVIWGVTDLLSKPFGVQDIALPIYPRLDP
jgi:DNA-binding response OmpR family regulator